MADTITIVFPNNHNKASLKSQYSMDRVGPTHIFGPDTVEEVKPGKNAFIVSTASEPIEVVGKISAAIGSSKLVVIHAGGRDGYNKIAYQMTPKEKMFGVYYHGSRVKSTKRITALLGVKVDTA